MTDYECLKHRVLTAADDGVYEWALGEIERLREALDKAAEALCDIGLYNSLADARTALEGGE